MQKRENLCVYFFFLVIYALFTIYTLMQKSIWAFDGFLWLVILIFLFRFRKKLNLNKVNFMWINVPLFLHIAGRFGAYSMYIFGIPYDKLLHTLSTIIVSFVVFKFIKYDVNKNDFKKHILFFGVAAIAISIALSLIVELNEFSGQFFVGQQDNILSPGTNLINGNYVDTMQDIIANILGAVAGSFLYFFKHKKHLSDL